MKRFLIMLAVVLPALVSCKEGVKDIKVTSVELVSVSPKGLKELDILLRVGLHNPIVGFEVTDLNGQVKIKGQNALLLTSDQLMVSGKCDKVYSIPVHGAMDPDYNPFQLLNFLNNKASLDDVTVDVKARVAMRGGIGKNIEYRDISVSRFLRK